MFGMPRSRVITRVSTNGVLALYACLLVVGLALILGFSLVTQSTPRSVAQLERRLETDGAPAGGHLGVVARLLETGEQVSVHGGEHFPMQSVYKLPIAMAVLRQVDEGHLNLNQKIRIEKNFYSSAHSPIREQYPQGGIELTLRELLAASIVDSDGVASDLLLARVSPRDVTFYLRSLGVKGMEVVASEKEMSQQWSVQYKNWASPEAVVELLQLLETRRVLSPGSQALFLDWMQQSKPGQHRIKALLPAGTLVAHKPGTSGTVGGLTAATNDVAILTLPDERHIALAVFVSDSRADEPTREGAIAKIARDVWNYWRLEAVSKSSSQTGARDKRIVIAASTVLDGRGSVVHDTRIVIDGSKIVALDPEATPVDYDLRGLTVLPGWIDAHVHITWSFGTDGKNAGQGGTTPEAADAATSNAWKTLMAGFTTVQDVGSLETIPLRNAIAKGQLPGPRILTSGEPLMGRGEKTGTPEEIRAFVRKQKEAGADLIKIYASGGMTRGGMTMSQEQLDAACDEAKKLSLRSLVHAYRNAVHAATLAGCTEIEHGLGAADDDLKLVAERGTYLDPQAGLLLETYLTYKDRYLAPPFYTEEGFAAMPGLIVAHQEFFKRALRIPGLKIVYGTDAVAGAHGRNAEDFVNRVRDCGMAPMAAMVSATSLNAEAMGLEHQIGSIAPGLEADIIALDGDPLEDITAVRRVVFVMKAGIVYKHVAPSAIPTYADVAP